LFKTLILQA